jgi:hypothetical protein
MDRVFAGSLGKARLVCGLLLVAAGVCGLLAAYEAVIARNIEARYRPAPCVVDRLDFDKETTWVNGKPEPEYTPTAVSYHFRLGDETHHGTTLTRMPETLTGRAAVTAFQNRYGPGASAECYYDPDDPGRSVLIKPSDWAVFVWLRAAGVCGLVGGLGLGALRVTAGRRSALWDPRRKPLTWGPEQAGDRDPLSRTRRLYRDKLES